MPYCNTSLVTIGDEAVKTEVPIYSTYTFHHLFLAITAIFALLATLTAFGLMFMHATHYSVPHQQRHILRILFMIPVYSIISLVSYVYYKHAIYWEVLRDCYEAFAIASFFTLLCHYLEEDLHNQKERFRTLRPRNWVWPIPWMQKCTGGKEKGLFRIPRSGLTWFNIIHVGVYSYCFIRVLFTFVAMFSQLFDRYCESSLNPAFAHLWVMSFEAVSVTIAMYCLIQFYVQMKDDLAEHKPFLKVCCIKLVIFFSFWQSIVISFLSSSATPGGAVLKPSPKIAYPDIKIGIPSVLLSIEMFFFAIIHIFAFPWKPYDVSKSPDPNLHYQGGFLGVRAFFDAFNLWDVVKSAARGFRWLFVGRRKRHLDSSYEASRHPAAGKFGAATDTSYHGPAGAPPAYQPATGYVAADEQEMGVYPSQPADGRGRPPNGGLQRTLSDEESDQRALLSHAQSIPRINVREPSPYDSAASRDESPYHPYRPHEGYGGDLGDPRGGRR